MDLQQLKLLAARIRTLLAQTDRPIGHSQSLDIAAAIPGLRNWPEVQAFTHRVTAARLDGPALGRLAFRLKRKFELDLNREQLLAALDPQADPSLPEIWPTGPAPGVYLTTSKDAIEALLVRFEEASDGALVYAEQAGSHWEGSIDLGEGGLWSNGLQRVPSGTLIVVGPVDLEQSSWDDSGGRLETACYKADLDRHRVAVLVNTPVPERVCEDVHLLVRSQRDAQGVEEALRGVVSERGELVERSPFVQQREHRALTVPLKFTARPDAIPSAARELMQPILQQHRAGLVLVGAGDISEHSADALVEASLALTHHCGPAARIMPRTRSTPSKYWNVPEAVKELPFLPSIQSAYDQGFRRIVVYGNYTDAELYLEYPDVLFIASGWGSHVAETFTITARLRRMEESAVLERVLAILSVVPLPRELVDFALSDLYLKSERSLPPAARYEDVMAFTESQRALRWESQFKQLLELAGEERISQIWRQRQYIDTARMLDKLLDDLNHSTQRRAAKDANPHASEAEIVTRNIVLQLAAKVRGRSGDTAGTM